MSQMTAAQPLENETPLNSTGRSSMLGIKSAAANHNAKFTQNQQGRLMHSGSANPSSTEESSTEVKSRSNSVRRSSSKAPNISASSKTPSNLSNVALKIKNQYICKKKEYAARKANIAKEEEAIRQLYNDVSELREKVIGTGGKDPGQIEGLKFEVGPPNQTSQQIVTPADQNREETNSKLEKNKNVDKIIDALKLQIQGMQRKSREICEDVFEKHSTLIALISSLLANQTENNDEANHRSSDIEEQIKVHQKNNESMKSRLEEVKLAEVEVESQLIKVISDLYDEYQRRQARHKNYESTPTEDEKESKAQLEVLTKDLQKEREENSQMKERLRQLDITLDRARMKIREQEAHIASDSTKIQQLQEKLKSSEQSMKQKNQMMEQRMKLMQKTQKNSETLISTVEKQRDSYEARLMELKQEMNAKENAALEQIADISNQLQTAIADAESEAEKRKLIEAELSDLKERYQSLEEKSQELCDLAEKNKPVPVTDGNHSEKEVRLFNELQATRAELEKQKEEMSHLQQEKEELIAVMQKAANHEDDQESHDKLAAELVCKSNELQNLLAQYNELKKVAKNAQEKNGILEKQLCDLQAGLHAQIVEGGKASINAHTIELQQQVSDLRNNLMEVLRQKDELENILTQKQLELEQRDQVLKDQGKFLKIRDEMLGLLKSRRQGTNEETSNSDENNEEIDQIAVKKEAIQELYKTITNKQLQVMRLEKMVKLMEDQQDRAQAQRTRLENRIAQLEFALQKNREHRSRGFGIL